MNTESFCYWLQGFVELTGQVPDQAQWEMIKQHLQLVFDKKTASKEDVDEWLNKVKKVDQPHTQYPDSTPKPFWQYQQPNITC